MNADLIPSLGNRQKKRSMASKSINSSKFDKDARVKFLEKEKDVLKGQVDVVQ